MPWTIDNALNDDLLDIVERNDEYGEYAFRVGELETVVTVTVRRLPQSEQATFRRSHSIHTPVQLAPYHTSRSYWDDVPYALHQAINGITSYYRQAVEAGHSPSESWLVED